MIINDLAPAVLIKVENRVNDTARAVEWIAEALVEISTDQQLRNDLTELEATGPNYNLTIGQQEYAETLFLNTPDANMASLDFNMWIDPPGNSIRIKLLPSHYQETDKFLVVNSLPVKWYRFGGNIGFYPVPNNTYQVQSRYLINYPIDWSNPGTSPVLLGQNWYEIIKLAAAQKGFLELEEYEKAAQIGNLLRGDPADPKRSPGLMYGRKTKRERESWREQQGLRPMIHSYTYRR